ncbi:archaeal/vacuolar-type H+-ATPase subunit I [Caldisphaera lagunensis DSM 15908]|uniref:A-type ATP synthase subunit I n=1 Tax=Caldisphaera lagunensis (strain DSM 15908 / JCM 11604 / ANMR 0165 / IC-154) TaxID=1056495 RepID=L0AAL8_CALLD|nr:V-type ATP synthase subunit I [Caldisphaera lagunensis]AFZ70926.1 archaeal/vacuolar-type H+-ATPase subunit I [Caldisphaera lagunensis DSM 15908]
MLIANRVEEVVIAVPNSVYDRVVASLATSGIFHIEPPTKELTKYSMKIYRSASALSSERKARLEGFFKAINKDPEIISGINIKISNWVDFLNEIINQNKDLEVFFEKNISNLNEIRNKVNDLLELKKLIGFISYLDVDIKKAHESKLISFSIGIIPEDMIEYAKNAAKDVILAYEKTQENYYTIAIAGNNDNVKKTYNDLIKLGFTAISIPSEFNGNPSKAYKEIEEEIKKLNEQIDNILKSLMEKYNNLKEYYTKIYVINEIFKILNNTASSETTSFIHGFVDAKDSKKLRNLIKNSTDDRYLIYSLGIKRGQREIPTKMSVPKAFKPFESIIKMYGIPNSNEIIPTIFMAITMPIIFGLMFPDIGHGLLVVLFALFFLVPRSKDLGKVALILGIVGMITGFLAAEFFGPLPAQAIHLEEFWRSLGFQSAPIESPVDISISGGSQQLMLKLFYLSMDISFWIGAFMLIFGTLLGIINSYLKRDFEDLYGEKLPLFLLFLSAGSPFLIYFNATQAGSTIKQALFGLGKGGPMEAFIFYGAIISLIWILLGKAIYRAIEGEGFKLNPIESFIGLFESMILVLGNSISFLRILGLSLAHSGLMVGFTILYFVIDPVGIKNPVLFIAAVIVYILGNLLTAGLEGIVAFAHDLRLHFYEWFNKFYTGNGVPFNPIQLPNVTITFI